MTAARPEGAMVMVPREPDPILMSVLASIVRRTAIPVGGDSDDVYFDNGMARKLYAAVTDSAAAQQSPLSGEGWQDISTAPKTDEANMVAVPFIGWCPEPEADGGGDQRICWWEPKTEGGKWWSDRDLPERPTLWRALPAGPLEGTK